MKLMLGKNSLVSLKFCYQCLFSIYELCIFLFQIKNVSVAGYHQMETSDENNVLNQGFTQSDHSSVENPSTQLLNQHASVNQKAEIPGSKDFM